MHHSTRVCHLRILPKIPSERISLNSTGLGPKSCFVQVLPVATSTLSFLTLPHKSIVCVGEFGWIFNDIFQNKLPKHAFLSHTPLAPPWGVSSDQIPGALKVFVESGCTARKRISQVSGQYQDPPSLSQHPSQSDQEEQRTRRRTSGAASSGDRVASSRIGNVVVPVIVGGRQTRPFPQSPSLHLLFHVAIFCQVICTKPHLQISIDTFVACAVPRKALRPWLHLACLPFHGTSRCLYHCS